MTLIVFLTLQTLCGTVGADDGPPRPAYERTEPTGTEIIHNEMPLQTYDLTEYKELGLLITDYHELWKYALNLEAQIISMKIEISALNSQVEIWKTAAEWEQKHALIWKTAYGEERKLRLSMEKSDRQTKWIPWAVVVAQSIAMAAIAIGD